MTDIISLRSYNSFECFICMESTDEMITNITSLNNNKCICNAKVHESCYRRWIEENNTCPLCRTNINDFHTLEIETLPNYIVVRNDRHKQYRCLEGCIVIAIIFSVVTIVMIGIN